MRRFLGISLALVMLAIVTGYFLGPAEILQKLRVGLAFEDEIPVRAVQTKRGSMTVEIHGSGTLEPLKEVEIVTMIPGLLEAVRFNVGEPVSAGQWVASIRATELIRRQREVEIGLEAVQADLGGKEKRLSDLEKKLAQVRELRDQDLIARKELTDAEAAVATADAQVKLAQAQAAQYRASLEQLRYLLKFSKVSAPVSGVITRRLSTPGTYLQRSEPILAMANLDVMRVTIQIPRASAGGIQRDMPARVTAETFPERVFDGHVVDTRSESETGDQGSEIEIQIANAKQLLKPGVRVSVSLSYEKANVLLIPRQAISEISGKSYVDVIANGRIQRRTITLGQRSQATAEVADGLREGEWIVVQSQRPLKTHSRVRVVSAKADS